MIAYCDGSVMGGNPGGHAVGGWIVKDGDKIVAYGCVDLGQGPEVTNNMAEYAAVLGLILWCSDNDIVLDAIYTDSRLITLQLSGDWKCSKPELVFFRDWIWQLNNVCENICWIPRAENKEADLVSRWLYDSSHLKRREHEHKFSEAEFITLELPEEMWRQCA